MKAGRNISPEIEEALAQGRAEGLREAAAFVAGLKQRRVPWLFRGLSDVPETDAEGWGDLKHSERVLMRSVAEAIGRLVDGAKAPEHKHLWSLDDNPICAICGTKKLDLLIEALLGAA